MNFFFQKVYNIQRHYFQRYLSTLKHTVEKSCVTHMIFLEVKKVSQMNVTVYSCKWFGLSIQISAKAWDVWKGLFISELMVRMKVQEDVKALCHYDQLGVTSGQVTGDIDNGDSLFKLIQSIINAKIAKDNNNNNNAMPIINA